MRTLKYSTGSKLTMIYFDETAKPIDISIPLRFDGPQPNAFGVDVAHAETLGDTRTGSSINFERYMFTPHCNGTHTECVGHITDERISMRACLTDTIVPAVLITVEPAVLGNGDLIISGSEILRAFSVVFAHRRFDEIGSPHTALIFRTLPNDDSKLSRAYTASEPPAYFTAKAMTYIVHSGYKHLLVDLPSIDRMDDGGKLENHRIFWNVKPESRKIDAATRINSTITELIYVPSVVPDGEYLLNLQIAPFETDCSPSRPILSESPA